jgi:hypothetical protein
MEQLSDPSTHRYKVRLAASISLLCSGVLAWLYWSDEKFRGDVVVLLIVICGMAGAITLTVRRQFWYIADEVSHDRQFLVARRGRREARIPLSDVADVYAVDANAGEEGIAISLGGAVKPFGTTIVFLPLDWRKLKGEPMDELAARIKSRLGVPRQPSVEK